MSKHAVIIHFQYLSEELDALFDLENKLRSVIAANGVGEYDGHEIAVDGSDAALFMYGPDADELFEVVRPTLERSGLMENATAIKQYGPPEDDEVEETQIVFGNAMRNHN